MLAAMKPPWRVVVYGPSGSGKSTTINKIVSEVGGYFDKIIVNAENATDNPNYSYATQCFDGDAFERFARIVQYQKESLRQGRKLLKILLCLEDFSTIYSGANSKKLAKFVLTARHYAISIITVAHRLSSLPTQVRDNCTGIFVVARPRPDQFKIIAGISEMEENELRRACERVQVGRVLYLPAREDSAYFLEVEPKYATRELDDLGDADYE